MQIQRHLEDQRRVVQLEAIALRGHDLCGEVFGSGDGVAENRRRNDAS